MKIKNVEPGTWVKLPSPMKPSHYSSYGDERTDVVRVLRRVKVIDSEYGNTDVVHVIADGWDGFLKVDARTKVKKVR